MADPLALRDATMRHIESRDGARLAVHSVGHGPLTAVIANGIGGTLLAWKPLIDALEGRVRFVSWDYRGLYDSGPVPADRLGVEHHVADLQAVLDAEGIDVAVLMGWSMGVQVVLQAACDLPDRVSGLVLLNGTYGRIFDTAFEKLGGRRLLPALNRLAVAAAPVLPHVVRLAASQPLLLVALERAGLVDPRLDKAIFTSIAQGFQRLDFATYHRMLGELAKHDVGPHLARIDVPTLVVAGGRDLMTPQKVVDTILDRVPNSRAVRVPMGTHYSLIEYPEAVVPEVVAFLEDVAAQR